MIINVFIFLDPCICKQNPGLEGVAPFHNRREYDKTGTTPFQPAPAAGHVPER